MNVQGVRALVLTAELGSILFERTQNKIKLNAAGEALLPSAVMALS